MQIQSHSEVLEVRTSTYEFRGEGEHNSYRNSTPRKTPRGRISMLLEWLLEAWTNDGRTKKAEEPELP